MRFYVEFVRYWDVLSISVKKIDKLGSQIKWSMGYKQYDLIIV